MTTNFKENSTDIDQLYLGSAGGYSSIFYVGGNVVIAGNPLEAFRSEPFKTLKVGFVNEEIYDDVEICAEWMPALNSNLYSIFLKKSLSMYFLGTGSWNRLGDSNNVTISSPLLVSNDSWVSMVSTRYNLWGIKPDGSLWVNGDKWHMGQSYEYRAFPGSIVNFPSDKRWRIISRNDFTKVIGMDVSGNLWGCGNNYSGSLGIGTTTPVSSWVQIGSSNKWTAFDTIENTTLAIDTSGRLWAWGANTEYQLGNGGGVGDVYSTPVQVGTRSDWVQVCLGVDHALGVAGTSKVLYAWGKNSTGQLGIGTTSSRITPVVVTGMSSIALITAGDGFSLATKFNTITYSWGKNDVGQLGLGHVTNKSTAVAISTTSGFIQISAGRKQVHGIRDYDGTMSNSLYSWGGQDYGELGVKPVTTGFSVPTATYGSSRVYGAGGTYISNATYINSTFYNATYLVVGSVTAYVAGIGYSLSSFEQNGFFNQLSEPWTWTSSIVQVAGANRLMKQATNSNNLFSTTDAPWNNLIHGRSPAYFVNVPSSENIGVWCTSSFVKLGSSSWRALYGFDSFIHAIKSDSTLWAAGFPTGGYAYPSGFDYNVGSSSLVQKFSNITGGISIITAGGLACRFVISNSGQLWSWGANDSGKLGTGLGTSNGWNGSAALINSNTDWNLVYDMGRQASIMRRSGVFYGSGAVGIYQGAADGVANVSTPVVLSIFPTDFVSLFEGKVSAGKIPYGIKSDGTLWGYIQGLPVLGWEANWVFTDDPNYLGDKMTIIASNQTSSSPVQISGKTTWVKIKIVENCFVGLLSGRE